MLSCERSQDVELKYAYIPYFVRVELCGVHYGMQAGGYTYVL